MFFLAGIATAHYNSTFKSNHRLCLSILKQFGFGRRVMETRILIEVEEMINKVREQQGRPYDMQQLIMYCVVNVIMNMMFGHRFDHSDPDFQHFIFSIREALMEYSFVLELFPALRVFPYFKKVIATYFRSEKAVRNFIIKNIDACTQVCNSVR